LLLEGKNERNIEKIDGRGEQQGKRKFVGMKEINIEREK
jgi:hypothetical protein